MRAAIEFLVAILLPSIIGLSIYSKNLPRYNLALYKVFYILLLLFITFTIGCLSKEFLCGDVSYPKARFLSLNALSVIMMGMLVFDLFRPPPSYDNHKSSHRQPINKSPMFIPLIVGSIVTFLLAVFLIICFINFHPTDTDDSIFNKMYQFIFQCRSTKYCTSFGLLYIPEECSELAQSLEEAIMPNKYRSIDYY
ncbi:MAG: hypothetical protein CBB84_000115 [Phycisphaera sp. TMED24]|nr:MAG: hypothetical protein CBB84_000115 [Phycisphaera sp. TMED24]